jgi:hypothetical protein
MTSSHKKDFDALASAYMGIFEGKSEFKPCSHCNHESKCIEAGRCLRDEDSVHEAKIPAESGTKIAIDTSIETNKAEKEAKTTGVKLPAKVQKMAQTAGKTIDNKTKQLQASNNIK